MRQYSLSPNRFVTPAKMREMSARHRRKAEEMKEAGVMSEAVEFMKLSAEVMRHAVAAEELGPDGVWDMDNGIAVDKSKPGRLFASAEHEREWLERDQIPYAE